MRWRDFHFHWKPLKYSHAESAYIGGENFSGDEQMVQEIKFAYEAAYHFYYFDFISIVTERDCHL